MILARLADCARYLSLHPALQRGFEFLQEADLSDLSEGRHDIDGDRLFAIVARGFGRGQADSPLEFHRNYLDLQYVTHGFDLIGWSPIAECKHIREEYSPETDLGFFHDRPSTWCRLAAGDFAIFYPEDAHAPLGGTGPCHKVVVKVAL